MAPRPIGPVGAAAAWAAWSVAGLSVAAAAFAVGLRPDRGIPWDSVLFPVLFCIPGALIAWQLPRHPVGWLMLAVGACFAANAVSLQWLASGRDAGAGTMAWWSDRGSAAIVPLTLLLILLLPDGRLPSPRWRLLVVAIMTAQLAVVALWCLVPVLPAGWRPVVDALELMLVVPFLLGVAAVAQRLRTPRDRPVVVSVLAGVLVFVLLVTVPDLVWPRAGQWFHIVAAAVLCGSILGAVVRGRFDRVQVAVSQALIYSVLTVIVILAYLGLVAASARIGVPDELAGLVTAAVALALLPARGILQRGLRRAMYGDRGEPQRALRRLSSSVADHDDLPGVLQGLASSVRASLRARWVEAEFRGHRAETGTRDGSVPEALALDGGDQDGGVLRIGLGMGRSLRVDERELLRDLADQGARAARVVCLAADLAVARQTLVESREKERSRLRRDLHDDLGPLLAGMAMQLGSLGELVSADADLATTRLQRLEAEARVALERTRHLSRDLRPARLDDLGLVGAVVEAGRALGVQVSTSGTPAPELSAAAQVAAYRIATEAVLNAQRHARADVVDLGLHLDGDTLLVEVVDHGPGLADAPTGVGLESMRNRAAELGGTLELEETPGGGLTVRARIPDAVAPAGAR